MKVIIKWEHGDADFNTKSTYSFETEKQVRLFLNFLYDLRNGPTQYTHNHTERESEHVDAVCEKYDNQFDDYIVADERYSYPIAVIYNIHLKDVNKRKHIVWLDACKEEAIVLPKIGDVVETTTGNVNGCGGIFGLRSSKYIGYHEFEEKGLILDKRKDGTKAENYPAIKGIVKDIKINGFEKKSLREYKSEFTRFTYNILLEYETGELFVTSMQGYDKTHPMNEDFLFFY